MTSFKILKEDKTKWINLSLFVIIFIQLIFMIYTNFFCVKITLDNDAAKSMVHAIEIWNYKTVFLKGWSMMTTLETGTPTFIAVIVYGLTHNIFVSYAVANMIILAIYIMLFVGISNRLMMSDTGMLIGIVLLVTPFSFGQLLYYNMMFYAAGAYSIRLIIPLLMVYLLTDDGKNFGKWLATLIFTCLLCFLCGISTGIYVVITTLLPVIFAYFWMIILRKENIFSDFFCKKNISCIATCATTLVGLFVYKIKHINANGFDIDYITWDKVGASFLGMIEGWFEGFGAFPHNEVTIASLSGMIHAIKLMIAGICFAAIIYCIRYAVRGMFPSKSDVRNVSEVEKTRDLAVAMFMLIILINLFMCITTATGNQSRYMLMAMIPSFLFAGIIVSEIMERLDISKWQNLLLNAGIVCVLLIVAVTSDLTVVKGDCYPEQKGNNAKLSWVMETLSKYPQKQVYFLGDTGSTEVIRLLDYNSDKVYSTYVVEASEWNRNEVGVNVHDYFVNITDAASMDQDNIMVVNSELAFIEQMPGYVRKNYTLVEEYQNYSIYVSNVNKLDGVIGYEDNNISKDYCYSRGYKILTGEIDDEGNLTLIGLGDYALESPLLGESNGSLNITMNYISSEEGVIGRLEAYDAYAGELMGTADIVGGANYVSIAPFDITGRNIVVKVFVNEGCTLSIKDFVFEK